MKDNLILSTIRNLKYSEFAPFLDSLRACGSTAKVHFFVSGVDEKTLEKVREAGATVEPFTYFSVRRRQPMNYLWALWKPILAKRDFAGRRALGRWVLHLMAVRFILYYEFLASRRDQFENVLLTDCRDVFFQRDPFAENLGPGLHCFLESAHLTIGTNASNTRMILNAFGPEVLAELANHPISCAGTTIGDSASMLLYLQTMIELVCEGRKMVSSNDQGVHNYIVHRRLIPGLQVHDNYSSSVFTAGCEAREDIHLNERGEVVRRDGQVYPVLHQLDRHVETYAKLLAKLHGAGAA